MSPPYRTPLRQPLRAPGVQASSPSFSLSSSSSLTSSSKLAAHFSSSSPSYSLVASSSSSSPPTSSATSRLTQISSHIANMGSNTASVFTTSQVAQAPEDPLFGLMRAYRADTSDKKVDLGIGAYRDDNAKPWILPVVRKVNQSLGDPPFRLLVFASSSSHPSFLEILPNANYKGIHTLINGPG